MNLECFPVVNRPPDIVPGRPQRGWMDRFHDRHAYRCLPLTMANTSGWELLCPYGFTAEWTGGPGVADLTVIPDPDTDPQKPRIAMSHFAGGTLTFHTGYLFRTQPGWAVLASGPPNTVKHGVQAMSGLVETDWLP